jgi:hypothetical protein
MFGWPRPKGNFNGYFIIGCLVALAIALLLRFGGSSKPKDQSQPKTAFTSPGTVLRGKVVHREYIKGRLSLVTVDRMGARHDCVVNDHIAPILNQEVAFLTRSLNGLSSDGGITPQSGFPTSLCWIVSEEDVELIKNDPNSAVTIQDP